MKKVLLTSVIIFLSILGVYAQELDLTKGEMNNITTADGKTFISNGGSIVLPITDYSGTKGLKFNISAFEAEDGSNQGQRCTLVIEYKDKSGNQAKAPWGFYKDGKKDLRFNKWSNDELDIDPASIEKIILSIQKGKKLDLTNVSLIK